MAYVSFLHQYCPHRTTTVPRSYRLRPLDWTELAGTWETGTRVRHDMLKGLATDTHRTYQRYWELWVTFCEIFGVGIEVT
jgi:hypothetical protein